jgi:3-mercaptopyruvate sulfurtransferase SseA
MVDMTRTKKIPILAALMILAASCTPATPAQEPTVVSTAIPTFATEATPSRNGLPQTEADVPRVSVEETAAAIQSGEAVVLDVRSAQAYQAGHLPGALSIPLAEIETNPTGLNLDKNKWIITYCT